jgi:prepilin-type N-terminal cleavage/methylation domain-containing protein
MSLSNKSKGFTLAETLISLLVIGIISSLVIPAILQDMQNAEYKTAYKKAFADVSNALNRARADNTLVSPSGYTDLSNHRLNFYAIKKYFTVSVDCDSNNMNRCWDMTGEKFRTGDPTNGTTGFIDNAGRSWAHRSSGASNIILLDTNGFRKPNKLGKDRFPLWISNGKVSAQTGFVDPVYTVNSIGQPVKIDPFADVYDNASGSNVCITCPCYYTTWIKN